MLVSERVACTLVVAGSRSTSTSVSEPTNPASGTNSKRREVVPLCSDEVGMTTESLKSALPTSSVAPAYTLTLPLMTVPYGAFGADIDAAATSQSPTTGVGLEM